MIYLTRLDRGISISVERQQEVIKKWNSVFSKKDKIFVFVDTSYFGIDAVLQKAFERANGDITFVICNRRAFYFFDYDNKNIVEYSLQLLKETKIPKSWDLLDINGIHIADLGVHLFNEAYIYNDFDLLSCFTKISNEMINKRKVKKEKVPTDLVETIRKIDNGNKHNEIELVYSKFEDK